MKELNVLGDWDENGDVRYTLVGHKVICATDARAVLFAYRAALAWRRFRDRLIRPRRAKGRGK